MTLADEIRTFCYKRYIEPARKRGDSQITKRAGDVHDIMGLKSRMPAVCGALGTNKFLREYNLKLLNREGPTCGANVFFTFELEKFRSAHMGALRL